MDEDRNGSATRWRPDWATSSDGDHRGRGGRVVGNVAAASRSRLIVRIGRRNGVAVVSDVRRGALDATVSERHVGIRGGLDDLLEATAAPVR